MAYGRTMVQAPPYAGGGSVPISNYGVGSNDGSYATAAGMVGQGLSQMSSRYKNPFDSAGGYFNEASDSLHHYYDPIIERGNRQGNQLEGQYGSLLNNPGGRLNEIGGAYQQSPGFQFALQQALQGAGNAAAAGGMAGSPQHQQQAMQLATNLANQDYNTWIQNALGLYGRGMGGAESMYNIGANAGMGMGDNLASLEAQKAKLAMEGQNADNQRSGIGSTLGGGLGMAAGAYFGGPMGAMAGQSIGSYLGGKIGGGR